MDRPVCRGVRTLQGGLRRHLRGALRIAIARAQRAARRTRAARAWARGRSTSIVPTPRQSAPVPIRSTGASVALQDLGPAIGALAGSVFVADCTVEGLMHAAELPADPERRRAGAVHLQRAPRRARAPGPLLRRRGAGEGGHAPDARGQGDEGHLPCRHEARHPHRGRARGRRVGLHREAGHAVALARRPVPRLPEGRQRQRHAGDGARRPQPHLQALYRNPGAPDDRERLRDERSTASRWTRS